MERSSVQPSSPFPRRAPPDTALKIRPGIRSGTTSRAGTPVTLNWTYNLLNRSPNPSSTDKDTSGKDNSGDGLIPHPKGTNRYDALLRWMAYRPLINAMLRVLLRLVTLASSRLAGQLHERIPAVGFCPAALADGSSFSVVVDADSHPTMQSLCRYGFAAVEAEVAPVFERLVKASHVFLDVGSHVGVYALAAAAMNPTTEVVAFEPVPSVFDRLQENVLRNHFANILCVNAAVSDREGTTILFVPAGSSPTTASQEADHRLRHPYERNNEPGSFSCRIVPTVTLDQVVALARTKAVDLIKIDVERAEVSVLHGMSKILETDRPHIICEVFPEEWTGRDACSEIQAILGKYGYSYYLLTSGQDGFAVVHHKDIVGDPCHPNHLFTPLDPDALSDALNHPVVRRYSDADPASP
jgi:FkbM family methyltransferase